MLTVAGGIYREICLRPSWDEIYGSAGRAASSIAALGAKVKLMGFADPLAESSMRDRAHLSGFEFAPTLVDRGVSFIYDHGLAKPSIRMSKVEPRPIQIDEDRVLRFGMLEGDAVVKARHAVYDPQNVGRSEPFSANGSSAERLAVVLNRSEAAALVRDRAMSASEMASKIAAMEKAEVVVLKHGPQGALLWHKGEVHSIPSYQTPRVWKIGSGDQFAANFAYGWIEEGRDPIDAANRASRATAFYCEHRCFPTSADLDTYHPDPIFVSESFAGGKRPLIYLAGPFFSLGQLWIIEQAKHCLEGLGLEVFSPYHDVGPGIAEIVVPQDIQGIRDCDLLYAIGDGLDSGTLFEIGYARRDGKPVVLYVENESTEDCKMMAGSDCFIRDDFVSSIYQAVWTAASL